MIFFQVKRAIMSYKVFLSHSTKDADLVNSITRAADELGIEIYVAEQDKHPGTPIVDKIQRNITNSQTIVVLLTPTGLGSQYLQQEIGFAKRDGKLIIPIKHPKVITEDLAMLEGIEYIPLDPQNPEEALSDLTDYLAKLKTARDRGAIFALVASLLIVFIARNKGGW